MDKKLIFLLIISCKVVASSQETGGPFGIGSSNRQSASLGTSHLYDPRETFGTHALEQHAFRPLMHQQPAPAYCYPLLLMNNVNNVVPFPVMMPQQQLVGANLNGVQYPYPFPNIPMFWMPAQNTNFHPMVNHQTLQHPLSQLDGFSASKHSQDQTRTSLHDGPPPLIYHDQLSTNDDAPEIGIGDSLPEGPPPLIYHDQLRNDYKAPKKYLDHSDGGVRKSVPREKHFSSKLLSLTPENSVSDQQLKNAQDKGNALLYTDISSLGDFSTDGERLNLSMDLQGGQLMEEVTADHSVPNNQKAHVTSLNTSDRAQDKGRLSRSSMISFATDSDVVATDEKDIDTISDEENNHLQFVVQQRQTAPLGLSSSSSSFPSTSTMEPLSLEQLIYLEQSQLMKHPDIQRFVVASKKNYGFTGPMIANLTKAAHFQALSHVYTQVKRQDELQAALNTSYQPFSSENVKPPIISLETFKKRSESDQDLILKILSNSLFFHFFYQYPNRFNGWEKFYCEEHNLFLTLEKGKTFGKAVFGIEKIRSLFDNNREKISPEPFFTKFASRMSSIKRRASGKKDKPSLDALH